MFSDIQKWYKINLEESLKKLKLKFKEENHFQYSLDFIEGDVNAFFDKFEAIVTYTYTAINEQTIDDVSPSTMKKINGTFTIDYLYENEYRHSLQLETKWEKKDKINEDAKEFAAYFSNLAIRCLRKSTNENASIYVKVDNGYTKTKSFLKLKKVLALIDISIEELYTNNSSLWYTDSPNSLIIGTGKYSYEGLVQSQNVILAYLSKIYKKDLNSNMNYRVFDITTVHFNYKEAVMCFNVDKSKPFNGFRLDYYFKNHGGEGISCCPQNEAEIQIILEQQYRDLQSQLVTGDYIKLLSTI